MSSSLHGFPRLCSWIEGAWNCRHIGIIIPPSELAVLRVTVLSRKDPARCTGLGRDLGQRMFHINEH
uniref:Uncharacterized protein n=1 Tax=Timema shepardi TaxID=629360 RepID=A0A7R9B686_TIMSH|nr:unnamed protein product [Timema shepardi]